MSIINVCDMCICGMWNDVNAALGHSDTLTLTQIIEAVSLQTMRLAL